MYFVLTGSSLWAGLASKKNGPVNVNRYFKFLQSQAEFIKVSAALPQVKPEASKGVSNQWFTNLKLFPNFG